MPGGSFFIYIYLMYSQYIYLVCIFVAPRAYCERPRNVVDTSGGSILSNLCMIAPGEIRIVLCG